MEKKQIRETAVWQLYQLGQEFHNMENIYTDTDKNYRFYNGDQWYGAKLGGVEPVQKNFIKPIIKYKLAVIHDNLYALNFSAQNFESIEFQKEADRYCKMLNRNAARNWERDGMDYLLRQMTFDSAVNGEGIIYISYDPSKKQTVHEIVKKNDIYYGNENEPRIQKQPYILVRKRMPVSEAEEYARSAGLGGQKLKLIRGDNETFTESGDAAKQEVTDQVTVVYKLYKDKGTVKFSSATRYVEIETDVDIGIDLYPIEHMNWEPREGSARGEGECKSLIPNQIEVNKVEMRRIITVKNTAYQQKVVAVDNVENPDALDSVGGVIHVSGQNVDDVRKFVGYLQPAQMSSDVKQLEDDLISMSRELAGAGDIATGDVNPESASGRAILAVQQASKAPLNSQRDELKRVIESIGKIENAYLIAYAGSGIILEEEVKDPATGRTFIQPVRVPASLLKKLQAEVKVDVTPKGVYDKFAQEQTIENFLMNGLLNPQRASELRIYAEMLDDDAVTPKLKIIEAVEKMEQKQMQIAQIQARAQMMRQNVQQFLSADPSAQAAQMVDANTMV